MICLILNLAVMGTGKPKKMKIAQSWEVDQVIAAFPVGFYFITTNNTQFAAYYDKDHNMKVATRKLDCDEWSYKTLPTKIGWDSHNFVTMAFDKEGFIHLSGNMHCAPLIYFRSTEPWNISTLERIHSMCGTKEKRCTYPSFMFNQNGELIFHYRDGGSGNGMEVYNIYDCADKKWRRLMDKPLIDGQGKMNAYMFGPIEGNDGFFHLCWVWRDTFKCETNHDISYARSRDLINWENAHGQALTLPITFQSPNVLIDSVPVKGGMINGCNRIGFDSNNQTIITYHKFDADGNTQAYAARYEDGAWRISQLTEWSHRWYFEGGGSIGSKDVALGTIEQHSPGRLALPYSHKKYKNGQLIIDEKTLKAVGRESRSNFLPAGFGKTESKFPGIRARIAYDRGDDSDPDTRYVLRWETIGANRDRKPPEPHPEPSRLMLYRLSY